MKKSILVPALFTFLLLFFFSCRNDDDDAQSALIGKWQPYKMTQAATLSTGPVNYTTNFTECQQKTRITFNDETNGNSTVYGEEGGVCVQQENSNFTYTYNSSTGALVIDPANAEAQSGVVKTLTGSDLVYEMKGTYDFEGETVEVTTTFYTRKTNN